MTLFSKKVVISIGVLSTTIAIFLLAVWSIKEMPYSAPARERVTLLGGEFEAVVRTANSWVRLVPTFPGQSGDRPGTLTIYRVADKMSCGSAKLDIVGLFTLDSEDDGKTVTLGRPRDALWNLDTCTIRFHNLYPEFE